MTGERDDERTFSSLERDMLSERLADLMKRVAGNGFAEAEIGVDLLVDLHRTLFEGVRDHAGRVRRPGWGQEALTFGPHRSTLRDRVPGELERVFRDEPFGRPGVRGSMSAFATPPLAAGARAFLRGGS